MADSVLRLALADPRGNINPNQDTITLAELATALGVDGVNGAEWIAEPFYGEASDGSPWQGFAYTSGGLPHAGAGPAGIGVVWPNIGGAAVSRVVGLMKVLDFTPTAIAEVMHVFRPVSGVTAAPAPLDFYEALTPIIGTGADTPAPIAYVLQAWMRKQGAADATACRQFLGFANVFDPDFSRRSSFVGVVGDGLVGFRFGSVNCPDAPAGAVQNAATDIDAGSVQPAALVTPGASWFHVKVKLAPPVPGGLSGRVGVYLNGVLVATFSSTANLPRTARTSIDVQGAPYVAIQPVLAVWPNPDGVTVDPGLYLRDVRFAYTADTAL